MKITPAMLATIHALGMEGLSGRAIADRLGCSEPTVRRALKRPVRVERSAARTRAPVLLSRPLHEPAPCPETAAPWIRKLYGSLAQRGLWSELDALIVFSELEVPRCHLLLGWFDVDSLLCRLEAFGDPIDFTVGLERLRDAARWDDALRDWCRQVAQDADLCASGRASAGVTGPSC
jgi:hypothetical protein